MTRSVLQLTYSPTIPILSLDLIQTLSNGETSTEGKPSIPDATDILDLYLQRPASIAHFGMGLWFMRALQLGDSELYYMVRNHEALKYLKSQGYLEIPDVLIQLKHFNESLMEK